MLKKTITFCAAAFLLASSVLAAEFPNYYPKDGFQRVGQLDAVQLQRQVIIINDVPYNLSDNVIVHSTSSYSVPTSRLSVGSQIGYKMTGQGRLITEIWLLPNGYRHTPRR